MRPDTSIRLDRLLAVLLHYGTWLASAVIALGISWALLDGSFAAADQETGFGIRIINMGIVLFILLPVLRVLLMLFVFARGRDYAFVGITSLVLAILLLGFVLGVYMPNAGGH